MEGGEHNTAYIDGCTGKIAEETSSLDPVEKDHLREEPRPPPFNPLSIPAAQMGAMEIDDSSDEEDDEDVKRQLHTVYHERQQKYMCLVHAWNNSWSNTRRIEPPEAINTVAAVEKKLQAMYPERDLRDHYNPDPAEPRQGNFSIWAWQFILSRPPKDQQGRDKWPASSLTLLGDSHATTTLATLRDLVVRRGDRRGIIMVRNGAHATCIKIHGEVLTHHESYKARPYQLTEQRWHKLRGRAALYAISTGSASSNGQPDAERYFETIEREHVEWTKRKKQQTSDEKLREEGKRRHHSYQFHTGDCLFDTLALLLNPCHPGITAGDVRNRAMDHLQAALGNNEEWATAALTDIQQAHKLHDNAADYIASMRIEARKGGGQKVWGDQIALISAARAYSHRIHTWMHDTNEKVEMSDPDHSQWPTIEVAFLASAQHYEPIVAATIPNTTTTTTTTKVAETTATEKPKVKTTKATKAKGKTPNNSHPLAQRNQQKSTPDLAEEETKRPIKRKKTDPQPKKGNQTHSQTTQKSITQFFKPHLSKTVDTDIEMPTQIKPDSEQKQQTPTTPAPTTQPTPASAPRPAPQDSPVRPMRRPLKLLTYNARGLWTAQADVKNMLRETQPDIAVLTETNLHPKQSKSHWIRKTLEGYKYWMATHEREGPTTRGDRGVIIAIKTHLAVLGEAAQEETTQHQGRLAQVTLKWPHSQTITITGLYAPAGHTPPEEAERLALQNWIQNHLTSRPQGSALELLMGDTNAALFPSDREGQNTQPQDAIHQTFIKEAKLYALDPPQGETPRPPTHNATNAPTTSRIDDILTNIPAPEGSSTKVLQNGELSDHFPLLGHLALANTQVYIPTEIPTTDRKPTPVLVRPISLQDQAHLQAAIQDPIQSNDLTRHVQDLDRELTHALLHSVNPHLKVLEESHDGKSPQRLQLICKGPGSKAQPAGTAITDWAGTITAVCTTILDLAMKTCTTKTSNPGGKHHSNNKEKRYRKKLRKYRQALTHLQLYLREAAELDCHPPQDMERHLEGTERQTWQKAWSAQQDRERAGGVEATTAREVLQQEQAATRGEITKHDRDIAEQTRKYAAKRMQHLIHTNPKVAHKLLLHEPTDRNTHHALRNPATGDITNDPAELKRIVTDYYTNLGKTPGNREKQGNYMPPSQVGKDPCGDFPWSKQGAKDRYMIQTDASHTQKRTWLHQHIQDEVAFSEALSTLSNNKAPGPDQIPNEILKLLPEDLKKCIHKLMIIMWTTGTTPRDWKLSYTNLLEKDNADTADLKKKRPIGLLNTMYKLWTKLVSRGLARYAETNRILSTAQAGFRQHQNTMDQIQLLIMALEDARLTGQNLYMLQVDFSSAFNMIDQDKLLTIMYELGFPADAIEVIKDLYTGAETKIRWGPVETDNIPVNRGTIQGDSLSPFLFLVYLEPLLRWLQVGGKGYSFGSVKPEDRAELSLGSVAYADDLGIVTNTVSDLQAQAEKLSQYSEWAAMRVNPTKTTVSGILHQNTMLKGQWGTTDPTKNIERQLRNQIQVQGQTIPYRGPKDEFTYLGATLTLTLDWRPQHRVIAQKITGKLQNLGKSQATPEQVLKVIQSAIKPSGAYVLGVIPYTAADIQALDSLILSTVRKAHGLPRYTPTAMLREDIDRCGLGCPSLAVEYHQQHAYNLVNALRHEGRTRRITEALMHKQLELQSNPISSRDQAHNLKYNMRIRQLASLHDSRLYLQEGDRRLFEHIPAKLVEQIHSLHAKHTQAHKKPINTGFLRPLLKLGFTHLESVLEADGKHIMDGQALQRTYGRGVKTEQIQALNHLAALLQMDPLRDDGEGEETGAAAPKIDRDASRNREKEHRRIHDNYLAALTLETPTNLTETPYPTPHSDQHLITDYFQNTQAPSSENPEAKTPPRPAANPTEDTQIKRRNHTNTPTNRMPCSHTANRKSDPEKLAHKRRRKTQQPAAQTFQRKACLKPRIPKATIDISHNQKETTAARMFMPYKINETDKLTAWQLAKAKEKASGIIDAMYGDTFRYKSIKAWRMTTAPPTATQKEKITQIQYLIEWEDNILEEWALDYFKLIGYGTERREPSSRSAMKDTNDDTCPICWKQHHQHHPTEEDEEDQEDKIECCECAATLHTRCLGMDPTGGTPQGWTCPACTHSPPSPGDDPYTLVTWTPTWEPDTTMQLPTGVLDTWRREQEGHPPARMEPPPAPDHHLAPMQQQGASERPAARAEQKARGFQIKQTTSIILDSINNHTDTGPTPDGRPAIDRLTLPMWAPGPAEEIDTSAAGEPPTKTTELYRVRLGNGRCTALITTECLEKLHTLYHKAEQNGLHKNMEPAPKGFAEEVVSLLCRNRVRPTPKKGQQLPSTTPTLTHSLPASLTRAIAEALLPAPPNDSIQTIYEGAKVERHGNPLHVSDSNTHYYSKDQRDRAFGAHTDAYTHKWGGFSIATIGPTHEEQERALQHACWSAATPTATPTPTATFLLLPRKTRCLQLPPAHAKWQTLYPDHCSHLATIRGPKGIPLNQPVPWQKDTNTPETPSWDLDIVAAWNPPAQSMLQWEHVATRKGVLDQIQEACSRLDSALQVLEHTTKPDHPAKRHRTSTQHSQRPAIQRPQSLPPSSRFRHLPPQPALPSLNTETEGQNTPPNLPMGPTRTPTLAFPEDKMVFTDGSCTKVACRGGGTMQVTGGGVWAPGGTVKKAYLVNPGGMGSMNTITTAELAAIAAALDLVEDCTCIATDSATALHLIRRAIHHTTKLTDHKHRRMLARIMDSLGQRAERGQHTTFLKVKAHNGIVGNEMADYIAKRATTTTVHDRDYTEVNAQASTRQSVWPCRRSDPALHANGAPNPDGGGKRQKTAAAPHAGPLDNLQADMKKHMHHHHRLGTANTDSVYYRIYQQVLPTIDRDLSNYSTTGNRRLGRKHIVTFKHRAGVTWNNKKAHQFKMISSPNCPLCQELDGSHHIASGCTHTTMQLMYTERHNRLGRKVLKAISKGPLGAYITHADLGCEQKCREEGVPYYQRFTVGAGAGQSRPDIIMKIPANVTNQYPKGATLLVEIKTCHDTRPEEQIQACHHQHRAWVEAAGRRQPQDQDNTDNTTAAPRTHPTHSLTTIVPIVVGVTGVIYTEHTLANLKKLGLDTAAARRCATNIHQEATDQLQAIICTRRKLEPKQQFTTKRQTNRTQRKNTNSRYKPP